MPEPTPRQIRIVEQPLESLATYHRISPVFEIVSEFEVRLIDGGLGGVTFTEREVSPPRSKNYDDLTPPASWAEDFDVSNWGLAIAPVDDEAAGGCVIAHNTSGVNMLEGRSDMSVLWDIRVAPSFRGRGLGSRLFDHACTWSRGRGCVAMKIETQTNNVAACRFYRSRGCDLRSIDRFAYPDLPGEVQVNWILPLVARPTPRPESPAGLAE